MGKPEFRKFKDEYSDFKLQANKILANANAVFDTDTRALPNSGKVYDLFDTTNDYSAGKLDTTATTLTSAVLAGASFLPVASVTGFTAGQEVTVYDDVGQENAVITTPGSFSATGATISATATDAGYSSYSTYTQGRHLLMLSDGTLISAWMDSAATVYLSKSTDGGATWSVLTTVGNYSGQPYFGISTDGTYIHFLITWSTFIGYKKFNVAGVTVTRNDALDAAITGASEGCSIEVAPDGSIHTAWSCVVAAYPNSKNLRYASSSDGGVTWSAITQLTTDNTSGYVNNHPCLVINANSKPVVIFQYYPATSTRTLYSMIYTTSWSAKTYMYSLGSSGGATSPSAIRDSSGAIHVAFVADWSFTVIRYNKSTDGGVSWTGNTVLYTSGSNVQYAPSIGVDKNNNVYVAWVDSANGTVVQLITYSSGSWGARSSHITGFAPKLMSNNSLVYTSVPMMYLDTSMKFKGTFTNNILGISNATANGYKSGAGVARSNVLISGNKMNFGSVVAGGITYDKSTPVNVATGIAYASTGDTNGKKIVVAPDGTIYAVWYGNASNQQIFVYKSTDHGATWVTTSFTNFSGYTEITPSLAVDSSNNLHMIWQGYTASYPSIYNILYAKYNGASWGGAVNITTGSSYNQRTPSLAIDNVGYLHAVWYGQEAASNIKYSRSVDGGTTWAAATYLTSGSTYNYYAPSIAVDNLNNLHVVWHGINATYPTYYNIHYMKYSGSWGTDTLITTGNSYHQTAPNIAVDSINNLHVVWYGITAGNAVNNIQYAKFNGVSWSSITMLTSGSTYYHYFPTVSIDSSDNIHVIWLGTDSIDTGTDNVKYIKYSGGAWGAVVRLTTGSTAYVYPSSCVNYKYFTQPLIVYGISSASSTLKFSGIMSTAVTTQLLTAVARYNITPPLGTFNDMAMWVQHDRATPDSNFTVTGALSINDSASPESYNAMTQTTTNLSAGTAEEQLLNSVATPRNDGCLKITMTRANTSITPAITKIIGAID